MKRACLLLLLFLATPAYANSYPVTVTKVIDGDTFQIETPWMEFEELTLKVRVRDLDTPEAGKRAKCDQERHNAEAASAFLKRIIRQNRNKVVLSNVKHDKYGGRINADVTLPDGRDLADEMVLRGYARHYDGGKRKSWCD